MLIDVQPIAYDINEILGEKNKVHIFATEQYNKLVDYENSGRCNEFNEGYYRSLKDLLEVIIFEPQNR